MIFEGPIILVPTTELGVSYTKTIVRKNEITIHMEKTSTK